MLATLDRDPDGIGPGDPLPPLFHWLYCRELTRRSQLDDDGHRRKGEFLPQFPFPRRMWVGGRLSFSGEFTIGDPIERTSTLRKITPKNGRDGPFLLVTIEHRVTSEGGEIVEEQDLAYLECSTERSTAPRGRLSSRSPEVRPDWSESITPDAAMLFRFSALTFNTHRIHYDREYAREVERYPDLVVHGPFVALLLADLAVREVDRTLATFSFRARRPLFVDRPIILEGGEHATGAALRALDDAGAVAMTAEARFA